MVAVMEARSSQKPAVPCYHPEGLGKPGSQGLAFLFCISVLILSTDLIVESDIGFMSAEELRAHAVFLCVSKSKECLTDT